MRERIGQQGQSLDMRERIGQQGQSLDMRERIGQQGQSYLTAAEKVWRVGLGHLVFSRSTMHQLFSKSTKEFLANRERDLSRHCTLTTYLRDRSSYGPCVVLLMSADLKSYGSAAILQPSLPQFSSHGQTFHIITLTPLIARSFLIYHPGTRRWALWVWAMESFTSTQS